jgi:hypothetical protein
MQLRSCIESPPKILNRRVPDVLLVVEGHDHAAAGRTEAVAGTGASESFFISKDDSARLLS